MRLMQKVHFDGTRVKVEQKSPEPTHTEEEIAEAVINVARGIKQLRSGRLSDKALLLLISYATPAPHMSLREVQTVLDAMEDLEAKYIRKKT